LAWYMHFNNSGGAKPFILAWYMHFNNSGGAKPVLLWRLVYHGLST
jgi:hypothetical protein